jgi:hypothetical protein
MRSAANATITWRSWLVYACFGVSWAVIFLLADQLHWFLPLRCDSLQFVDNDRSIVVSAKVGMSFHRENLLYFDKDLHPQRKIRLADKLGLIRVAFSEDGKSFVKVLKTEDGFQFELRSLADPKRPLHIVRPDFHATESLYYVDECRLIGSPPSSIAARVGPDTYSFDLLGNVKSRTTDGLIMNPDERPYSSSNYFINTSQRNQVQGLEELQCFFVDPQGLELVFQEPALIYEWKAVVSDNGYLALQQKDSVRVIDLTPIEDSRNESEFSWPIADGELQGISASGRTLLLCNDHELSVVSGENGTVLGRLPNGPPNGPRGLKAISDDRVVLVQSRAVQHDIKIVAWDWKNSTTTEYTLDHPLSRLVAYCIAIGLLFAWAGVFFRFAVYRDDRGFGMIVILAMVSIWMRWVYTHPSEEQFHYMFDLREAGLVFVSWQIVLALCCVWLFRYAPVPLASGLTLCLASYIYFFMYLRHRSDLALTANVFAIAGVGLVIIFSWLAFKRGKSLRMSFAQILILMTAIGFSLKLYSNSRISPIDFSKVFVNDPYNGRHLYLTLTGGIALTVLTLLATYLARWKIRWVLAIAALPMLVLLAILGIPTHPMFQTFTGVAWMGMVAITAAGSFVTWLFLSAFYCCFERPASPKQSG